MRNIKQRISRLMIACMFAAFGLMLVWDQSVPPSQITGGQVRRLSHACGFRPWWCCSSDMGECVKCADTQSKCSPLSYDTTIGLTQPELLCCCGSSADCESDPFLADYYDCRLITTMKSRTFIAAVGDGEVTISSDFSAVFQARSECPYDDCVFEYVSGTN